MSDQADDPQTVDPNDFPDQAPDVDGDNSAADDVAAAETVGAEPDAAEIGNAESDAPNSTPLGSASTENEPTETEQTEPTETEPTEPEPAEPEPELFSRFDFQSETAEAVRHAAADAARRAIENGDCIVLPTDTVYGIGADAFSADAVQGLLDAKGRGRDMPPPVLIAEPGLIKALAVEVPDVAKALVEKHWPGALTVIFKAQPSLRWDLGETKGTVALRVPNHELTRTLLRETGPMAVSSANLSGKPAACTIDDAIEQLGNAVSVYLDGGPLGQVDADTPPPASTIVDFSQSEHGQILRNGALSLEVIRETCPEVEDLDPPDEPTAAEPETTDLAVEAGPGDTDSADPVSGESDADDTDPDDIKALIIDAEPAPETASETVPAPETVSDTETATDADSDPASEADSEPAPGGESVFEPYPEPVPEAGSAPEAEPESEVALTPDPESDSLPETGGQGDKP